MSRMKSSSCYLLSPQEELNLKKINCISEEEKLLWVESNKIQKKNDRIKRIKERLDFCGTRGIVKSFCKKCQADGKSFDDSFIGEQKTVFTCHLKYCDKSHDVIQRFMRLKESINDIQRFKDLKTLIHLEFGFAWIYKSQFDVKSEQFKRVINNVFSKLRRLGHKFEYIGCIDFVEHGDMIFLHLHYGLTPIPKKYYRKFLADLKLIEAVLNRNKKIDSNNFHAQSEGYRPKKSIINYIVKRASGLYKKGENNPEYKHLSNSSLEEQLKEKYFYLLKDIFTIEQYSEMMFNKRFFFSSKGLRFKLLNGSNKSSISYQDICPVHGKLERCDLGLMFIWQDNGFDPPPGLLKEEYEEIVINENM